MSLDGPRVPAASGNQKHLVIFLHGYGADGDDLIGLSKNWAGVLPDAAFVAPHAPNFCVQVPTGRQWYPIPTIGDPNKNPQIVEALEGLDSFITDECEASCLSEDCVALVGFSQGAMMALAAGLRRNCAGIVGYSSTLLEVNKNSTNTAVAPPVLLCHGDADPVVPVTALFDTLARLSGSVRWHVAAGLGHGIDRHCLALGGEFLANMFSDIRAQFIAPVPLGGSQTLTPLPK